MAIFLDLPREIRDTIYSHVFSAPNSIIQISGVGGRITGRVDRHGATEYMETALLFVNRTISAEAVEHLYSRNTFHPASPLSHFVTWLRSLTDTNRGLIRRLSFARGSLMPLLFDNTPAWSDLCHIVAGSGSTPPMQLNTILVHVPLDFQIYVPSPALGLRKLLSNREQFWWPSVKFFLSLLMTGKDTPQPPYTIKQLKLVSPPLDLEDIPAFQQPLLRPVTGPDAIDLEELEATRILRSPRCPEDDADAEAEVLAKMKQSGSRGAYTKRAWREWHATEPRASREPLNFHVRWEAGKEAEMLVIE